ncbi:uncharacterized protein LOC126746131 isoform X2 [Anthonomus grandis grandis]|uniref:uncharacterized protein LOC126746131 isoform X2 n=1 Tax=Anthonomus grandis grandis TaxID=2921223 RepID=UPI00216584A6|nr:uncharacterized protein LOC126746131 isoform X2 [Anthonomus grandis grandis]
MVVLRRKSDNKGANGLYVHSNPPRILSVSAAHIKQLIRNGDIDKLEQVVYEGQGKKLVGEYSADYKTRTFIRSVPSLMSKISLLHDAVNSDKLSELQTILDEEPEKKKKLAMAKDECGVGLLHKAVYYDLKSIYRWLIDKFPQTVNMRDSEGRTPIFYSLTCKDPAAVQKLLTVAGADPHVQDVRQHTVKYYANHLQELELPSGVKSLTTSRKSTATGESLNFKKSNIRIWIHQRNLANLQQVVWEGHGPKLLVEHSNNPKIRKFLDAVPCIMGLIKDVHCDVQNDDLENLKNRVSSPVPIAVLTAKDSNGLTPLHKAVGLGREDIAKFIIETVPNSVTAVDNERRTPLHYSALLKDDNKMFNYLIEHGADESALDHRQKTAAYYKMRTSELDPKLLQVVPDCPRCSKEPNNFDWSMLTSAATSLPLNGVKKAAEKIQNGTKELVDPPQEPMKKEEEEEEVKQNGTSHEEDKDEMEKAPTEEDPGNIIEGDVDEETEPENTDSPEDAPKEETEEPNNNNEEEINEPEEEKHEENGEGEEEGKEDEEETPPEATKVEEESHEDDKEPIERPPSEADTIENKAENNEENKREEEEEEEEKEEEEETKIEEQKEDKKDKEHTQTVEPEIEGVVDGQHEVETMNNDGQNPDDVTDPESVKSMIRSGNMEQLAALVLNGDGDKLIGEKSDNPELQTFLNNVPVYMSKIHKIHVSAREGNLRDLQAALDRRKFAVARDVVSPNGATPLHVAIVFVRTSIVRYLAGRFPETVHMEDDNGRTPLHYAAVLKDNGHYYNLLLHLGADSRVKDKFGHTPEFYLKNQSDFNHRQILTEFHAEEMLDDILNDKVPNDTASARKDMDNEDMLTVLDRCYVVLHGRRNSDSLNLHSGVSSVTSRANIVSKQFKRHTFDQIKTRLTKLDHNLYDLIWPSVKKLPTEAGVRYSLEEDFPLGIVAPDFYSYAVFHEFLDPIIKEYNYIDHLENFPQPVQNCWLKEDEVDVDLDPPGKSILIATLECTRNIQEFELPKSLSLQALETVERLVTNILLSIGTAKALYPNASEDEIKENGCGLYYTMNEVLEEPSEARIILASNNLLIPLWNLPESDRLHGKHWPYGRGVFINNNYTLAVYVNVLDHIRVVTSTSHSSPGTIGLIYSRMSRIMTVFQEELSFVTDSRLGHLTARPTVLGCGLKFELTMRCPYLLKESENLRQLCTVRGLTYKRSSGTSEVFKVSNYVTVGVSELQCFQDLVTAVSNILQLEKDMSMTNSLHIAALFLSIFKKKKSAAAVHNQ